MKQHPPASGCLHLLSRTLPCAFHPVLQVHEKLEGQLASLGPALQVDVLWALCVLGQAQEAELRAVLCPQFHTQLLGEQWDAPRSCIEGSLAAVFNPATPAGTPLPGRSVYSRVGGWESQAGSRAGQGSPTFAALPIPEGAPSAPDQGQSRARVGVLQPLPLGSSVLPPWSSWPSVPLPTHCTSSLR